MGIPFEKKYIQFSEDDISKIKSTYHNWQQIDYEKTYNNIAEFCYSTSFEEVVKKDFSLVPSKYIKFINNDENINFDERMESLQAQFTNLFKEDESSKKELMTIFKELGYEIKL